MTVGREKRSSPCELIKQFDHETTDDAGTQWEGVDKQALCLDYGVSQRDPPFAFALRTDFPSAEKVEREKKKSTRKLEHST